MLPTDSFTAASTRTTLRRVCASQGLVSRDAIMVRMGENAIWALPHDGVMVRIARSVARMCQVRKEVEVARWLASHGLPAASLVDGLDQAVVIDGRIVTFWKLLQESSEPVDIDEFATMLRDLHALPAPTGFDLPAFDPLPMTTERLDRIGDLLDDGDRLFLQERNHELQEAFRGLDFELPQGPVHGDAHPGNLLRDTSGRIHLIDFEVFALGPREWDLAVPGVWFQGMDWMTEQQYRTFATIYGYDVTRWTGFPVLRGIRELNMTTWLGQNAHDSADVAREFRNRVADLRQGQAPRRWITF